MAAVEFSIGNDIVIDLGNPVVPLVAEEERLLWSSGDITVGQLNNSVSMTVTYGTFDPDTNVVSPFGFSLVAIIEQQQEDNTWLEIGRQNSPIAKLRQGAVREIIVSTASTLQEEGVDQAIAGFGGVVVKLKSRFIDSAEGTLRLCIAVRDDYPDGPNPFVSVLISAHGKRYDS